MITAGRSGTGNQRNLKKPRREKSVREWDRVFAAESAAEWGGAELGASGAEQEISGTSRSRAEKSRSENGTEFSLLIMRLNGAERNWNRRKNGKPE